jgi:TP53 regulating kinase-like protein
MTVNDKEYRIIQLLGKGKSGYSYLVSDGEREYVIKQIHHEPCSYYQFGDKLRAELHAYDVLFHIGIPMPKLLDVDFEQERILKEYIDGETVYELVLQKRLRADQLGQMREMCGRLYEAGKNIDYFPTNFVVHDLKLYYVDYEYNDYMEEWNFENWGQKYWSRTPELLQYAKEHTQEKEQETPEQCGAREAL